MVGHEASFLAVFRNLWPFGYFLAVLWPIYKYFDTRKRDQDLKEFEVYHKLIKDLVQGDERGNIFQDRQAAIVYELRKFPRYYDFSYRTVINLKEYWNRPPKENIRLIEEIDLAIVFLDRKINNNWARFIRRFFNAR